MTRDARVYFAGSESKKVHSAAALLAQSPLSKVLGNLFLGLNKPLFPTRLFTSEKDAIEWLKGYID